MNTVSSMKLISLFSRLALIGVAVFVLGVALNVQPLALFSFAIGALVLLVAAGDYTPRARVWQPRRGQVIDFTPPAPARVAAPAKLAA
jgi:hypothetical protein